MHGVDMEPGESIRQPLRILLFSAFFPPYNTVGAVRVDRMAAQLTARGHHIEVITAAPHDLPATLEPELAVRRTHATRWLRPPRRPSGAQAAPPGSVRRPGRKGRSRILRPALYAWGKWLHRNVFYTPDKYLGWYPFAVARGLRLTKTRTWDLLMASSFPPTSLLACATVARIRHIPWVAELRDHWAGHQFDERAYWQKRVDRWVEDHTLNTAIGLVTVDDSIASELRRRHHKPCAVVPNAYDPPARVVATNPLRPRSELNLVYTGTYYAGWQDFSPLLGAILDDPRLAAAVSIHVFGEDGGSLAEQVAETAGAPARVVAYGLRPRDEALAAQRHADVLISAPAQVEVELGIVQTKLYEYAAAGRPVLVLAPPHSAAGSFVLDRGLGYACTEPPAIADVLRRCLAEKRRHGHVPAPESDITDLSRVARAAQLEAFLLELTAARPT